MCSALDLPIAGQLTSLDQAPIRLTLADWRADVVIEAAGNAAALMVSAAAVGRGGRIVNLGSTRDYVDATGLMNRLAQ